MSGEVAELILRLRAQAVGEAATSRMITDARYGPNYESIAKENTAVWRAADLIESLAVSAAHSDPVAVDRDLRQMLTRVRDTGLIYWEPATARGSENKALMIAEIERLLGRTSDGVPTAADLRRNSIRTLADLIEPGIQRWLDWCGTNNEEPEARSGAVTAVEALLLSDMPSGKPPGRITDLLSEVRLLSHEVSRLRSEADGEFVRAAAEVMQNYPGFEARDYEADGITAESFAAFFREDLGEAWHQVERTAAAEKLRLEFTQDEIDKINLLGGEMANQGHGMLTTLLHRVVTLLELNRAGS